MKFDVFRRRAGHPSELVNSGSMVKRLFLHFMFV